MIKQYPLRIDSQLKEQIEQIAKSEKRSFNNMVEIILTKYMDDIQDKNLDDLRLQTNKRISVNLEEI